MSARVLIIQFPGVNCEYESLRAVESVGLSGEIRRWNDARAAVREAAAVLVPGGWSYQDRIRAGVVAAKDGVMDEVAEAAARGVPVLGICNGAQILVESGIVPGFAPGSVEVALAPNAMTGRRGYYCAWVHVRRAPAKCLFTEDLPDGALPITLAHAEGRFVTSNRDARARLEAGEGVALTYCASDGAPAEAFPQNPNGSTHAIAALTNPAGNAMAIMPHPERAAWLHQVPRHVGGRWGGERRGGASASDLFAAGPGRAIFTALARAVKK